MERKFPKNVRQIGNVCDTPKIYVEDYADTYLNHLKEGAKEGPVGALLLGECHAIDEQECVRVTGAVKLSEISYEGQELQLEEAVLEEAKAEAREYFPGLEVTGWFLISPEGPMEVTASIARVHAKFFSQKNSLFIMKHAEEDEEVYFAYKYHELLQIGGHYIFYEKNPAMQNYMVTKRKQNGVFPSEVVEDKAAKNFRSAIREKLAVQEQKSNSKFVYITSAVLIVMALAIGVSALNNYDKINSVQSSIETLSKSVQTSGTDEADIDEEEAKSQNVTAEAKPVVSSVEEKEGEDYYTVQRGDTLAKISMKLYGTPGEAEAIRKMNGLSDGNLIFIGQKLLLP